MAESRPVTETVVLLAALLSTSAVAAQSVVIPVPAAVGQDGDGKILGELVSLNPPTAIVNIDGVPVELEITTSGPRAITADDVVYFTNLFCTGDAYMGSIGPPGSLEGLTGVKHIVVGPNEADGTYRVFRTTNSPAEGYVFESRYLVESNSCDSDVGAAAVHVPSEEIIPSPLDGFHGPSTSQPDRLWTVVGGTKITPPAP